MILRTNVIVGNTNAISEVKPELFNDSQKTIAEPILVEDVVEKLVAKDPNRELIEQCLPFPKKATSEEDLLTYHPSSTKENIIDMYKHGFEIFVQNGSNTIIWNKEQPRKRDPKNPEKLLYRNFETHQILFSSKELVFTDKELNKEFDIKVVLTNSFHRRTSHRFSLMIYKKNSKRGLYMSIPMTESSDEKEITKTAIRHSRTSIKEDLKEKITLMKTYIITDLQPLILSLKNTQLTKEEQKEFAQTMFLARIDAKKEDVGVSVRDMDIDALLASRNGALFEDNSLWSLMHRVDENYGGDGGKITDKDGNKAAICYTSVRTVKNSDGQETIKKRRNEIKEIYNLKRIQELSGTLWDEARNYINNRKNA